MKIVDYNKKEKNYKKLPIVPIIAIFAFVVTLGITFFILSNEKKNDIPDDGLLVATSIEEVEVPPASTPSPAVIDEPQPEAEPVNVSVEQVINYTSIYTDEESLQQLVKDTIMSANIQIEEACNDQDFEDFSIIMLAIDDARERNGFLETFAPSDGAESPLVGDQSNWTYLEVSGAIGGLLFYGKDPARSLLEPSDMLKNFVSNGIYYYNPELIDCFIISEVFDTAFVDGQTGNYDVNFEISFIYRDQEMIALVGNVDHAYRVLDVVKAEDLENFVVYTGITTETATQNVNSVNEGPIEETVNVPVQEEQSVQNNVQQYDSLSYLEDPNYDPWVGYPNYTGPREGYHYNWKIEDYVSDDTTVLSDAMGIESSISEEEYEASGGQYHGY